MPLAFLGVALASLVSLAHAADVSLPSDPAPTILHRPTPADQPLTPSTTGQVRVPVERALPRRIAYGINDLGEQLRIHLFRDWAAEFRYLRGTASSDLGTVHANVFGLRGYRFFPEHRRFRLYAGLEGDYVKTSLSSIDTSNNPSSIGTISGFGDTSGYAFGGFGGIEFRLWRRIAIDLDIGPYMIGLQEKVTKVSDTTLDFVGNTAINVYLF
jgi:hypothetical protein